MSEKALKIVPAPESRTSPEAKSETSSAKGLFARIGRKRLRTILLVGLPAIVLVIGLGIYLSGGRYISTDNAYVGAQKVLITPDISGKIVNVAIREGQHVNPGELDRHIDGDCQPHQQDDGDACEADRTGHAVQRCLADA